MGGNATNLETGNYTGTGEWYCKEDDNGEWTKYKTTFKFSFEPKLVIIYTTSGAVWFLWNFQSTAYPLNTEGSLDTTKTVNLAWEGKTLTCYSTNSASYQMNRQSSKYFWAAFG